jgi:hypothetical protein
MSGTDRKGIVLQERDRRVLQELGVMRVGDREQIKCVAGFGSTTRANGRLLALTRAGLLRRFFLGTTAGGKKALYALSPNGAKLAQVPFRGPRRASDEILVADFFVTHQLEINKIYCKLRCQTHPSPGTQFLRWINLSEPVAPGSRLIPDGYFELATPKNTFAAFLEVDLGHESRTVWRKKVEEYLKFAVSGAFEQRYACAQFRVLTVTNSERRMASLRMTTCAITEKMSGLRRLTKSAAKPSGLPYGSGPRETNACRCSEPLCAIATTATGSRQASRSFATNAAGVSTSSCARGSIRIPGTPKFAHSAGAMICPRRSRMFPFG